LAAAPERLTSIAIPAQSKGHSSQGPSKDDVAYGTPKGMMFNRRRRARPKQKNGMRDQSLKWQLLLGSKRAFNMTIRQAIELEVMK
jgi:hypothetical protein